MSISGLNLKDLDNMNRYLIKKKTSNGRLKAILKR